MKKLLQKRIKKIVTLTVEDFDNSGKSTDETKESLMSWLTDTLMQDKDIEDLYTYEVSIKVLQMLNSLDIVNLEFIHNTVFKKPLKVGVNLSVVFNDVVL